MSRIITINREFGSGGREIGKRLAQALSMSYYDHEICTKIAKESNLDENYVSNLVEKGISNTMPLTFSNSISLIPAFVETAPLLLAKQHKLIKELAGKSDCLFVGRGADAVLSELNPLRIFVYAEEASKLKRCHERAPQGENLSDKELIRKMKQIDRARATNHDLVADYDWNDKFAYDLLINTTNVEIKSIIPSLTAYADAWFKNHQTP